MVSAGVVHEDLLLVIVKGLSRAAEDWANHALASPEPMRQAGVS
jgi:hypothetical protein